MPSAGNRRGGRNQRRKRAQGKEVDTRSLQFWAQGNPLWEWRDRNKVTRPEAAIMLGVGPTTIWLWENGAATPRREHMDRLVGVIGPTTVEQWVKWMAAKPDLSGPRR